MTASASVPTERPAQPYPGLRPFEVHEWSIFFGRERMIDDVIARLAQHHLVLIHGASGSGKSSLVRAGIMPKLARQHQRHGTPWLTCAMRPSGGPLWNLAAEFARLEGRAEDHERIGAIVGLFNRRDATLAGAAAEIDGLVGKSLCILVDQFEELFRFEKEASREEAELFVDLIARAAGAVDEVDLHVVVTMRSEFLGQCARFAGLAEIINRTQYLVPRMDDEALLRAVRRPAQMFGGTVAESLADRLIAQVRGREDELPLLQHGLMLMWDEAKRAAATGDRIALDGAMVEQAGGLAELLSTHADRIMESVAPDERRARIVESLFRELTDVNAEGAAIRRPRRFADLTAVAGAEADDLRPILDAFRAPGVSFLTPYAPAPLVASSIIDISHEALIRCWRRITQGQGSWLKQEFDDGLAWRSLLSEAEAFEKNPARVLSAAATKDRSSLFAARNELWSRRYGGGWALVEKLLAASRTAAARTRRQSRIAMASLASLAVGALALAYVSTVEWRQAEAEKAIFAELSETDRVLFDNVTKIGKPRMEGKDVAQELFQKTKIVADRGNVIALNTLGILYYNGLGTPVDFSKSFQSFKKAADKDYAKAIGNVALMYLNGAGVPQDYAKALEWYERAVAAGDVTSITSVGTMYDNGQGVPKDHFKAEGFYERAAIAGDVAAMRNIGINYETGEGVPRDYAKAREWYEKAAEAGDAASFTSIGLLYENGLGVPRDYAKAHEWFEKAAAAGDTNALTQIGFLYNKGWGYPQNYGKAREWYEKAAAAGDSAAMFNLGVLYDNGLGVPRDYVQARDWYEKAAAAGDSTAMANLGVFYENGLGVLRDYGKARDWYEKAAAGGDATAMRNIGVLYESARGVPRDYAKAREWYEKAAARGEATAMRYIGVLYESARGVPRDYAKAREWYEKAAAAGDATAMRYIGVLYESARGVPRDYAKAREWYEKAAAAGDAVAMTYVGILYKNGWGVQQDFGKAREWYEKGAAAGDANALTSIGLVYDNGQGVPIDHLKAQAYYQRAAAAGDASAMFDLGLLYDNGSGVPQDYAKAREWYEKAAAAGDAGAMRNIGVLYATAEGVTLNYGKAREWFQKAAAAGDSIAPRGLGMMYENGDGVSQDFAKAREWYQKAVDAGDQSSLRDLIWVSVLARDFSAALSAAEDAHKNAPGLLWTETNRAHALMFLGRTSEARALYLAHVNERVPEQDNKLWQAVVLDDFDQLRKAGLTNPLMQEIEATFAAGKK